MKKEKKTVATEQTKQPETLIVKNLYIEQIVSSPYNPRKSFDENDLNELAQSVKRYGILQPILVRPIAENRYEIVYGERRWRASKLAGLENISAQIKELDDDLAEDMALVENIQRVDINPYDQAYAMDRLLQKGCNIAEIVAKTGLSEKVVRTRLNILKLVPEVVSLLQNEDILLSNALELCKYDKDIQQKVYQEHLASDNDTQSWRRIKSITFAKNLNEGYMNDLQKYAFDKTDCKTCLENAVNQILFADCGDCSHCNNYDCISRKSTEYLVQESISVSEQNPGIIIQAHSNSDANAIQQLKDIGLQVGNIGWEYDYHAEPVIPALPNKENFEDQNDYEEAMINYNNKVEEHKEEREFFNKEINAGRYIKHLIIGKLGVKIMYKEKEEQEEILYDEDIDDQIEIVDEETGELTVKSISATLTKTDESPVEKDRQERIKNQLKSDSRNWEICNEKSIDDIKKEMKKVVFNGNNLLSVIEEKMLYHCILTYIPNDEIAKVFNLDKKGFISDQEKIIILENMTSKHKNLLMRLFINKNLIEKSFRSCISSILLKEFANIHTNKKATEITGSHKRIFDNRHKNIVQRLHDLGYTEGITENDFQMYNDLVLLHNTVKSDEVDALNASMVNEEEYPFYEDDELTEPQEEWTGVESPDFIHSAA